MKLVKWIFLLAVLGGIGWVGYKWYSSQSEVSPEALALIPQDAIFCLSMEDPAWTWKQVAGSGTWRYLQGNAHVAALTASANRLDSLVRDNDLLFDLIGSRSLIVSAHMTGLKQYDYLFLVDLRKASGIKFMNEYFSHFITEGLSVVKDKYNGEDLITVRDATRNANLYLSFPGSFLLASYNLKVVRNAIDAGKAPAPPEKMIRPEDAAGGNLLSVYVNHAMLPAFVSCYTNGRNEYVSRMAEALTTTALTFSLDDELLKATGYTGVNDSVESYLRTLAVSGSGSIDFPSVAPQRTAFAVSIGFESFQTFFENFEKNLQQDVAEYQTYRESLRQVENYLDIDLHEHFISWVGDEVALLEMQSYGPGADNETALMFKARDLGKARAGLAHIEKMIRRKTPVKFRTVEYRGHAISYLSMKGLFKMLLGKFFAQYDKPYYTIVDDFVIFSNRPQTLESIIDDYVEQTVLRASDEYADFSNAFENRNAVFVYVNTPVLFQQLKKLADPATRVSMEENRPYLVSFRHIGFQLVPDAGGFRSILAEQFMPEDEHLLTEERLPSDTAVAALPEPTPEEDPMVLPYLYVRNPGLPKHRDLFPDSTLHVEVDLKNGFKDGDFREYYANGKVRMKGHFKQDRREGVWRLFDEEGNLLLKRVYERNRIVREKTRD